MITAIIGDAHPPLYYLLAWITGQLLGWSEFAMRLPSLAASSATVLEIYWLIKQMSGEREARISSILMAILPAQLNYGQEARSYALYAYLAIMTLRAVLSGNWLRVSLGIAALLYTHNLSVFYLPVIGLAGLLKSPRAAIAAFMRGGAIWLPWSVFALKQLNTVSQGFWIAPPNPGALPYSLMFVTLFTRWPEWLVPHAIWLPVGLTLASLYLLRKELRRVWALAAFAVAPPALLLIVSMAWKPVMLERGLLPSGAALAGLWGIGLARLQGSNRWTALAIVGPMLIAGLAGFYTVNSEFDWRIPLKLIQNNWSDCDVIYHMNVASYIQVESYMPGKSILLPEANDLSQSLTDQTKDAMGIRRAPIESLKACRIWFIYIKTPLVSAKEYEFSKDVLAHYQILDRYDIASREMIDLRFYLLKGKQ